MKRILAFLLTLLMAMSCLPAMADTTPTPIETIPYDQIPENREGIHHYLLLCMDQWNLKNGKVAGNSDGIVLMTFDTKAGRIMLTSFMRDSLVKRPDGKIGRINYIVENYGPEALCEIISTHLNIKVEKYIIFTFQQIANIIDYMGGVDIPVEESEAAYLRRYPLSSTQTTPPMGRAGTYRFCGRAAVIYMRMRKGNTGGDMMRTFRVRKVLSLLADQCRVMTWDQAKSLLDNVTENSTTTNMSADDLLKALEQAYGLRACVIEELRIPQDDARKSITYAGMAVQDIDWVKTREDMADYLECSWLVLDDEDEDFYE